MQISIVECKHKEIIQITNGIEIGTCSICGQVVEYDNGHSTVTKLGRLNGGVTIPHSEKLRLSAGDKVDLAAARVAQYDAGPQLGANKPQTKTQWYRAHKEEMIADLLTMSEAGFQEKWQVKRQIISHLKSDPLYKKAKEKTKEEPPLVPQFRPARDPLTFPLVSLFPAFDASWPTEVQVKWLEGFLELCRLERSKSV